MAPSRLVVAYFIFFACGLSMAQPGNTPRVSTNADKSVAEWRMETEVELDLKHRLKAYYLTGSADYRTWTGPMDGDWELQVFKRWNDWGMLFNVYVSLWIPVPGDDWPEFKEAYDRAGKALVIEQYEHEGKPLRRELDGPDGKSRHANYTVKLDMPYLQEHEKQDLIIQAYHNDGRSVTVTIPSNALQGLMSLIYAEWFS